MNVRIGLVGAGAIAHAHAQSCRDLGLPFGVYSRGHAAEFAQRWSIEEYDTYEALLDATSIVLVASPTPTHEDLVLAAFAHGRDVICEKPLTLETAASLRLADAALRAGRRFLPAHVVRYFPAYAAIHDQVAAGAVGRVTHLHLSRRGASPWQSWFHDESSGGLVTDLLIHDYDQAMWLAGEVSEVRASRWYDDDGEHARIELTHGGGVLSEIEGTWGPQGTSFSSSIRVDGEAGTLDHDSTSPTDTYESPYTSQLRDLVSALTDGTTPRLTIDDGIRAVQVAEAVRTSLSTGEAVALTTRSEWR
jgi:myo-inositol 2-dehydrogenase/D-chiro-inositol 1-dehydrogenase